ncbi:MAG: hypothetical protein ACOYLX_21195, partial [Burkholderiaceae bacterium]
MRATWTGLERDAWERVHRTAAGALQQDWAYGEAMAALGTPCLRVMLDDGGAPTGAALFLVRRVLGVVSVALCSHGPVWAPGTAADVQAAALRAIRASGLLRRPRVLLYTPDAPLAECTGFSALRRVMRGLSDADALRDTLLARPETLSLHGHLHRRGQRTVTRDGATIHVLGATSASLEHHDPDRGAAYNVYDLDDAGHLIATSARVWDAARGDFTDLAL